MKTRYLTTILTSACLLVLLASSVAIAVAQSTTNVTAEDYVNSGTAMQIGGDWNGAIAAYTKAIELKPNGATAYYGRAMSKKAKGDLDGAIADYTKTIERLPGYADAYYNRGDAKSAKGDLDGAIADYTKAIGLKPDHTDAYYNRAYSKETINDLDGAIADYTKVIELSPKYATAYHSRGDLRYVTHDFTKALADFRDAIKLDSARDYARFWIWLIRARLGEAESATKELQKYLTGRTIGKPGDWESKVGRFLTGELAEPEFLAAAKNADPRMEVGQLCEAYFYVGSKHLFAGDKATATDYFQKSIATDKKTCMEYFSAVAELKFLKAQKN